MSTLPVPMCYSCAHQGVDGLSCTAFPDGIPIPILDSEVDHREPYTDDDGIVFEQDPALPEPDFELLGFVGDESGDESDG